MGGELKKKLRTTLPVEFILLLACDPVLIFVARLTCPLSESGLTREAELAENGHYKEFA